MFALLTASQSQQSNKIYKTLLTSTSRGVLPGGATYLDFFVSACAFWHTEPKGGVLSAGAANQDILRVRMQFSTDPTDATDKIGSKFVPLTTLDFVPS